MKSMDIKIKHIYPHLLNLYGDKGNINALKKRCEWRGISCSVDEINDLDNFSLEDCDILLMGGGYEKEMKMVNSCLLPEKEKIKEYIENDGVTLCFCNAFNMLGKTDDSSFGLDILNIMSHSAEKRLMGNVTAKCCLDGETFTIAGFENHSLCCDILSFSPLAVIDAGFGNDETSKKEGLVYKNLFATNLHGPLLPKNPRLTDIILTRALKKKYADFVNLEPLDDSLEQETLKNIIEITQNS